jgi:hypothetical protein
MTADNLVIEGLAAEVAWLKADLADAHEDLAVARELLSESLEQLHTAAEEIKRLRKQQAEFTKMLRPPQERQAAA